MAFLKQMRRKQDHRTIVVPTITSLNPDTWKEIPGRFLCFFFLKVGNLVGWKGLKLQPFVALIAYNI